MNKKMLVTSGYAVSVWATMIGILTAVFASSPNTITRATTVAGLLGVLGVSSFIFALISKD